VRGRTLTARSLALFGAGAAAIHQLRYAIAYGDAAPKALAAHDHGYLDLTLPAVATVFVVALAAMLIRIARGRTATPGGRTPLVALWLCCALALGTIYGVQETLEGAGALAGGGWIGFALAFPAGFLVALAMRGSDAATVEMPTALARIHVLAASAASVAITTAPRGAVDLRLGARAPPPAFVV
jgi:hypothetical protein